VLNYLEANAPEGCAQRATRKCDEEAGMIAMPDAMALECVGGPLDGERVLDHGLAWRVVTKSCSGVYVKQEDRYVWRPA
jgi:hypothetical protein